MSKIAIVLMLCCFDSLGQKYLIFIKNSHRQAIYRKGEEVSFRIKGDKSKITDRIEGFEGDSLIVFQDYKINPRQISDIYIDKKTKDWYIVRYKYEKLCLVSGIGFFVIDAINTGNIKNETLIISGSLVSASFLAKWLIKDRMRIRGRRKLAIIE